MIDTTRGSGMSLLKTVGACVLSIISYTAAFMLASGVFSLFYLVMTAVRPGIVHTLGAIAGSYCGVLSSRFLSDRWLKGYHPQILFALFAIISTLSLINLFVVEPFAWERFPLYASSAFTPIFAYVFFWRYEEI